MDWDKLRIFYAVAQSQSLTKAGETLALSQSAVSRQISALEEKLKITLFRRHARGLLLTEQGEMLFKTVAEMVSRLHATESALMETAARPKGPCTITAPVDLGAIWLAPMMKEFKDLYPDIDLTLIFDDRELDLGMREADVAIRLMPPKHPDLIQRQLGTLSHSIYASNDYLREHGVPRSLSDLASHRILTYTENYLPFPDVNWLMDLPQIRKLGVAPYIRMNSLNGLRRAIKVGMGIAAMPDFIMFRARHISKILPELPTPNTDIYICYPQEFRNSRRISAFRAFIERKLEEVKF